VIDIGLMLDRHKSSIYPGNCPYVNRPEPW